MLRQPARWVAKLLKIFSIFMWTIIQTVTIPNAYDDPRFDASVDENTAFRHKSILCMAIKNSLGQIIGVIQLINKFDDLVSSADVKSFHDANRCHFRSSPRTTRTSWRRSRYSAAWASTTRTCTRRPSLRWRSRASRSKFSAITRRHQLTMPFA